MSFCRLRDDLHAERYVDDALPWVHAAGNPYFDWLFGGPSSARRMLAQWMQRPSSEVWIGRATILTRGGRAAGGYLTLPGTELAQSRLADSLAMAVATGRQERAGMVSRLKAVRELFAPVGQDELYLSKLGVDSAFRRQGVGSALLEDFLATGRQLGFRRFRLDVSSGNSPAISLYRRAGFTVATRTPCEALGGEYLAMVLDDGGSRGSSRRDTGTL